MKLQLFIPSRDNGTVTLAVLSGLLTTALVWQLVAPSTAELPPVQAPATSPSTPVDVQSVVARPVLDERPLFSPARRPGAGGVEIERAVAEGAPPASPPRQRGPLGGAVVAGTVTDRGTTRIFLREPGGRLNALGIGSRYRGWRLARVTNTDVLFTRGNSRVVLPVGSAPADTSSDEDLQRQ